MKARYITITLATILATATLPVSAQQGQIDTSFNIGGGATNITQRLELLYDQSVFAGGDFTSFNGSSSRRMRRLAPNGSLSTWVPHTAVTGGADGPVRASAVQANGQLLIGGLFNTVNGSPSKNFARLDTTGAVDSTFNIGAGFNNEVVSIATEGNRIFAAGFFSAYKGVSVPGFVCLTLSGDIDTTWFKPSGFLSVDAIAAASGNVYIGGSLTSYNGVPVGRVARLRSDGTLDTSFNTGTGVTSGNIQAMCVQTDGKLIIAGTFSAVNGVACGRVARLNTNGSVDASFNAGSGANGTIRTLAVQHNTGKVYFGGDFTTVNGLSRPRIARVLSDGTTDTSFTVGTGTNGTVYSIIVQPDGNVVISGNFTQYNGITAGKIVRLTGEACIPNAVTVNATACGIYVFNGTSSYTSTGTYFHTLLNTGGCDSIVSLNLTILPKPATSPISGVSGPLLNSTHPYSVINTSGSVYHWYIVNGTQVSGNNTNSITVQWGNTPGAAAVKVVEQNSSNCFGDTVRFNTSAVIPVLLVSFEAHSIKEHGVLLQWRTASEINNNRFEIERSPDAQTFVQIAVVKGAGNTSGPISYRYEDRFPEKTSYYRLRQVDNDGRYTYSEIVNIGNANTQQPTIGVFPNPAGDCIALKGIPASGAAVYDMTGRMVFAIPGDGTYDTSLLQQGLYVIKSENAAIKLIIE